MFKKIRIVPFLLCLAIPLAVGGFTAFLTSGSMQQYQQLFKPPLAPPGFLFPIIWTILFLLMGAASYLVFTSHSPGKQKALRLYAVQLVVNALWSVLFFNLQAYWVAFFWLLLLWYLIFLTLREFQKIDPIAGYFLLPYLVWVTFAGYLNLVIAIAEA